MKYLNSAIVTDIKGTKETRYMSNYTIEPMDFDSAMIELNNRVSELRKSGETVEYINDHLVRYPAGTIEVL